MVTVLCSDLRAVEQGISREYTLKAAFVYKFATYVQWPEEAFDSPKSPFVIGILGPDPLSVHLRKIAAVKKIDGRKIEIRRFQDPQQVRGCHLLFISRALEAPAQQAAIKRLSGRNILFVGETPDFLEHGGVIDFGIQENRIVFYISKSAYERENLVVDARFLRVAKVVK